MNFFQIFNRVNIIVDNVISEKLFPKQVPIVLICESHSPIIRLILIKF